MPCLLSQNACILLRNFLEFYICQFLVFAQFWQGLLFHNSAARVRTPFFPPLRDKGNRGSWGGERRPRQGSALRFQIRTMFQSLWVLVALELVAAGQMRPGKSTLSLQQKVSPPRVNDLDWRHCPSLPSASGRGWVMVPQAGPQSGRRERSLPHSGPGSRSSGWFYHPSWAAETSHCFCK